MLESASCVGDKQRLLCDNLAAMTDGSATRFYKRITVPDFGSIGDLV